MLKQRSMTEARKHLTALVQEVEQEAAIELTRHGKPVAVLLSIDEYRRLTAGKVNYWQAYTTFREKVNLQQLDIQPEIFTDARDRAPGREVD